MGSFSYPSCFAFIFIRGVSLTHPVLASSFFFSFFSFFFFIFVLSGEFLLHIPCWCHFYLRILSYTSHAGFIFIGVVSLTHPVLASILRGEFLLHIPWWRNYTSRFAFIFIRGSFSYISRVGFFLLFFSFSFIYFFYLGSFSYKSRTVLIFYWGSFSYTSHTGFIFIGGAGVFSSREFLLHIPCWLLFFSLSGEFLLHIPCWIYYSVGSFSYTFRSGFVFHFILFYFIWGVSVTHPMLDLLFFGEFFVHIHC